MKMTIKLELTSRQIRTLWRFFEKLTLRLILAKILFGF